MQPLDVLVAMPAASMIAGDFGNVVVGFFGPGPELLVDPYSYFEFGIVTIGLWLSVDIGILLPGGFCKSTSIT